MSGQPPPQWLQNQQQPQYPPQHPPQQMWYPPIPPPPKDNSKIIAIIVVVVVLVVIIPTVLGFVLYFIVSGLLNNTYVDGHPVVAFASLTKGGAAPSNLTASWIVAGVTNENPFSAYKVQILRNGTPLSTVAQTILPQRIITFGTSTIKLIVRDHAGEGMLTGGDTFLVYGMSVGYSWSFSLIWGADGSLVQPLSWST